MPQFIEKEFKSALNKKNSIDSWFWDKYSINPYNGCLFGCIYCNSRSSKYQQPEDFENEIIVKKGLANELHRRLSRARTLYPDVVALSGVTDPYQAAEKKFRNTRQCLEVLHKFGFPVHIITKSDLVLEDLELLNRIGEKSWCTVSVTITTNDEKKAKFLENRSPHPERRFLVIEEIKKHAPNIQAGVLGIPLIPFFTDSKEELESVFSRAKAAGADYLLFSSGMTMHDMQANYFLQKVMEKYPKLIPRYESLYQFKYKPNNYQGLVTPTSEYQAEKNLLLLELSGKYNLPYRIKRFIPNDFRRVNYIIAERLLNEAFDFQLKGKDFKALYKAGAGIQNLPDSLYYYEIYAYLTVLDFLEGDIMERVKTWMQELKK